MLIWGRRPRRNAIGKQYVNAVIKKERTNGLVLFKTSTKCMLTKTECIISIFSKYIRLASYSLMMAPINKALSYI